MASSTRLDPRALDAFARILGHFGMQTGAEDLRRAFALDAGPLPEARLIRMARACGLKSKAVKLNWAKLMRLGRAFPCLGFMRDGTAMIFSGVEDRDEEAEPRLAVFTDSGLALVDRDQLEEIWDGRVLLLKKKEATTRSRFGLGWFVRRMGDEKRIFFEIALIAMFMHALAFVLPLFFQNVVDKVLTHKAVATLTVMGIAAVAAVSFEGVLRFLRQYLLRFATAKIDVRLAMATFSRLMKLPISFFERSFAGVVVKHMQQADQIREFLSGRLLETLLDASALFVFVPVLFLYSPKLTLLVLGFAGVTALVIALMIGPFQRRLTRLYEAEGRRQALLVEAVHGMHTVKSLALEPGRERAWEDGSAAAVSTNFSVEKWAAAGHAVIKTLERLMTVCIIWVGVTLVFAGDMSVGALIAFQMLAQNVTGPLIRLVEMIHEYQKTALSVTMLGEIMNRRPEPGFERQGIRPELTGSIDFDQVSFAYTPGGRQALAGVDLSVAPGEVIGVVGKSGSGKTTLTKLVQGLYEPEAGRVRLDGADLKDLDIRHLRSNIGVVLQENFIFHGTVKDNISMTKPGASFEEIRHAAKLAGAHEFIVELPKGYDTLLEENGSNLSGGQKQRLAIARALLRDPGIMIFDEATSALDPDSEAAIQKNIDDIAKGRTMIIVAHRLSTLRHADRIVVMDKGRVSKVGTHSELLMSSTIYRNLWEKQSMGRAA